MIVRRALFACAMGVFACVSSSPAISDDLAEVKAIFEKDVRLFNAQNKDAFVESAHDDVIAFGILSPFPVTGKEEFRQLVRHYLNEYAEVKFRPVNPQYSVVGTYALAWGAYTISEYPKVEGAKRLEMIHGRYTYSYTKTDEGWRLVALHLSPMQGY